MTSSKVGNSTSNFRRSKAVFCVELESADAAAEIFAWLCACSHSRERVNRIELTTSCPQSLPPRAWLPRLNGLNRRLWLWKMGTSLLCGLAILRKFLPVSF